MLPEVENEEIYYKDDAFPPSYRQSSRPLVYHHADELSDKLDVVTPVPKDVSIYRTNRKNRPLQELKEILQ
jgi:hypothetical protein